jgi:hypothetical protein
MSEAVSLTVVHQRIRNRIIEYPELASSYDEQRTYQAAVPAVSVPPNPLPPLPELLGTEPWDRLRYAAPKMVTDFKRWGKLPEDIGHPV